MPLPFDIWNIRSQRTSYIVDFLLFACELGAYIYFATFTSGHLRPYFVDHEMESDMDTAKKVLAYLIVLVVLEIPGGLRGRFEPEPSLNSCLFVLTFVILYFVNLFFWNAAVILASLTAYSSWNWWQYFNAIDEEFLAANCLGLFCTAIATIPLWVCHYVLFERREREENRPTQARVGSVAR